MNQIILSCNENEIYSSFWKPVAYAYSKMFPDVTVHLAFLTKRSENDELVKEFRKHGNVTLFKPLDYISEFSQAKMIRFILASQQGEDVCYIDDIDLFPLNKHFITSKTDKRPSDHLLCVGGEVYHHNGCYPISQMTAEGNLWKEFINPKDLDYEELFKSWIGETKFDVRENPLIELDFSKDSYFSDERLLRRLLFYNPVQRKEVERGYTNFLEATLDRYDWKVNLEKLNSHGYMNAHGIRPYNEKEYEPLIEYINTNFP